MLKHIINLSKSGVSVKTPVILLFFILLRIEAYGQLHTFEELYPKLEETKKARVFSSSGLVINSEKDNKLKLMPGETAGLNLSDSVLKKNPSFLMESLMVVPYSGKNISLVDIYNALGKVRNLKGRLYRSHSKNEEVPLFEEATRVESEKKLNNHLSDPSYRTALPLEETMYLYLKDTNFGNTYYRTDIKTGQNGLLYRMTNIKSLSYLIIPVIKEERFIAQLYLEPIAEGLLIYGITGADVSNFFSSRIDIPSAIRKRLAVIIDWVIEGVSG